MAMIQCPECKGSISDKAVFCPHCGYPLDGKQAEQIYDLKKGDASPSGLAIYD